VRALYAAGISVFASILLLSSPAGAAGALPEHATPVEREQAQARFVRAKDLMAKSNFDDALVELRASQEIVASPNTRLQIARCLSAQGKIVEAYVEFGRTAVESKELLAQDNRYQRAYEAAQAERTAIEPKLGFLSLDVQNPSEGTTVQVGGETLQRAAWTEPAPALAGAVLVVVETPGHGPIERTVSLDAGRKVALAIDAQSGSVVEGAAQESVVAPAPVAPNTASRAGIPPMRIGAFVAGGVGVVGLTTAAIFGAMATSTYGDLNGACGGGPCPQSRAGEISSGKMQQTLADVGLAAGVLGVGVAVPLFLLSTKAGSAQPTVGLAITPGWVGWKGEW
jgi:hypothetical protein